MSKLQQRKNLRLKDYDYSQPGYYFVTICTKDKLNLFGEIVGSIHESPLPRRSVLSKVVGYLKMNSSKQIHLINKNLEVWQRGYYEHVIRNQQELQEIREYIVNNPAKWQLDKYFT